MKWWGLFLSLLISFQAVAIVSGDRCDYRLRDLSTIEQLTKVSTVLEALPQLRKWVLEILTDTTIPLKVRSFLQRALLEEDLEVTNLTRELRAQAKIGALGLAHVSEPASWSYEELNDGGRTATNAALGLSLKMENRILVSDQPVYENHRIISSFVHELAHIRFNTFLWRNYDRICKRLPPSFIRTINGRCSMAVEVVRILDERYARETEIDMTLALWRYIPNEESRDIWKGLEPLPARERGEYFGDQMRGKSVVNEAQARLLADLRIGEVLHDKRVRILDRAIRILGDPHLNQPDAEQVIIVNAILNMVEELPKFNRGQHNQFREIRVLLSETPDGILRLRHALASTIFYADSSVALRTQLIRVLHDSPNLRNTMRKIGWSIPGRQQIRWKHLIQTAKRVPMTPDQTFNFD